MPRSNHKIILPEEKVSSIISILYLHSYFYLCIVSIAAPKVRYSSHRNKKKKRLQQRFVTRDDCFCEISKYSSKQNPFQSRVFHEPHPIQTKNVETKDANHIFAGPSLSRIVLSQKKGTLYFLSFLDSSK